MERIEVCKASPVADEVVPDVEIAVSKPQTAGTIEQVQDMFRDDAKRIADALLESLPGGTVSQLLAELLERRAVQLRVAMPKGTRS